MSIRPASRPARRRRRPARAFGFAAVPSMRPRSSRCAVFDQHVELAVEVLAGIDDPAALEKQLDMSCLRSGRRRADTAPPCARRRRWRPARESPSRAVGHLGGDLDAAVHRPGMHDDDVGLRPRTRSAVRPKSWKYSRSDGKNASAPSLLLDAQHHHHVGVAHRLLDACRRRRRRVARSPRGISVGGPQTTTVGAELLEQQHVRAQHAAVQQVADDRDPAGRRSSSCARGW